MPEKTRATGDQIVARHLFIVAALALSTLFMVACSLPGASSPSPNTLGSSCPVPNPSLMPAPWRPVGEGTFITVDDDDDLECLVIYRYNITGDNQGPLGGVIFDSQTGSGSVKTLIPYRLLPWISPSYVITATAPGSQPGYLGTLGEKSAEVRLYDTDGNSKPDELGIVGANAADSKTTLSLYRWAGSAEGYRLLGYFHGTDRVQIVSGPTAITDTKIYSGAVQVVRTFDPLYDRSGLAMVYQYERVGTGTTPSYSFRASSISFLNGVPSQTCYYPEGQVLLFYNNQRRPVFDLRVYREDERSGTATVCAGSWELRPDGWRQYVALVDLRRKANKLADGCDEWEVLPERILAGRISCAP